MFHTKSLMIILLLIALGKRAVPCTIDVDQNESTYLAPHAFGLTCEPKGCCRERKLRAWLSGVAFSNVETVMEATAPGMHTLTVEGAQTSHQNMSWRFALLDSQRMWSEWGLRPRQATRAAAPPLPRGAAVAQALAAAARRARRCTSFDVRYTTDGALPPGITLWADRACIYVGVHLRVVAGSELRIGAGTTVLFASGGLGALLVMNGRLNVAGSPSAPAVFDVTPADGGARWHGIAVVGFYSTARIQYAVIRNTGAGTRSLDLDEFHHPNAVAALHLGNGAQVEVLDTILADGSGQGITALGGDGTVIGETHVVMRRCHVARFRLGVELHNTTAAILDSVFEGFGDTGSFADDDNDGLYLAGGDVAIQNCTIANAGDDCIDAGSGFGGRLWIDRTTIFNCVHEGIALMNKGGPKNVSVTNVRISDAQQGIELGCASAETSVVVTHSVIDDCRVGVRYGDNNPSGANCPHDGGLRFEASNVLRRNDADMLDLVFEQSQGNWRGAAPGRFVYEAGELKTPSGNGPELAVVYNAASADRLLGVRLSPRDGRAKFAASNEAGSCASNPILPNTVETQIFFDLEGLLAENIDVATWYGEEGVRWRHHAVMAGVNDGTRSYFPVLDLGPHLRPSTMKWGAARGGVNRTFVVGDFNLFDGVEPLLPHNPLDVLIWIGHDVVDTLLERPVAYIRGPQLHYVAFGNHALRTAVSAADAQAFERKKGCAIDHSVALLFLDDASPSRYDRTKEEAHHYDHRDELPVFEIRLGNAKVSAFEWATVDFSMRGATTKMGAFAASGGARIKTFGASSAGAACKRKSFLLKLAGDASKVLGPRSPALQEFVLLSLCEDRGMFRNIATFRTAARLGLTASAFAAVELTGLGPIHAGIYLLAETPTAALRRRFPSTTAVLQRVNAGVAPIDTIGPIGGIGQLGTTQLRTTPFEESHDGLQAQTASYTWCSDDEALQSSCRVESRAHFHATLFNVTHSGLVGDELVQALRAAFDFDGYLSYTALNSVLMNGDAQDELYFAEVDGKYVFSAWDFDDVFMPCRTDRPLLRDALLHCAESALDGRLRDPSVRRLFQLALERLIANGGLAGFQGAFEQTVASISARFERILRQRPELAVPPMLENADAMPRLAAEVIGAIRERRATLARRLRYENDIFGAPAAPISIAERRAAELRLPRYEQLPVHVFDPAHDASKAAVLRLAPILDAVAIGDNTEDDRNRGTWAAWPNALVTLQGGSRALLQLPGKPYHLDVAKKSCVGPDARHVPIASTGGAQAAAMWLDRLLGFHRVPVSVVRHLTAVEVAALPIEMHDNAKIAAAMQREAQQGGSDDDVELDGGLNVTVVEWIDNICDARTRCGANPAKWGSAEQGKALGVESDPEWSWRNNYLPTRPDEFDRIDRLLEWSDMAIFDHISGNIDRCPSLNILTSRGADILSWDYQCNNLHVLGEDGAAVWIDVDETFHMPSVIAKWRDKGELRRLCVFRASTIQRLSAWDDAKGATLLAQGYRRHGVGALEEMASSTSLGFALQAKLREADGVHLPDILAEGVNARVKMVLEAVDYCVAEFGVQDSVVP
jgi:hypothetical protein